MKTELCAGTVSAVKIARQLGFDRVELCQMLEIGGITPSIGLQQLSVGIIETHVLIRPRGGGFVYSADEKELMLNDIAASREIGVRGVVVGALDENNNLDLEWLKQAIEVSGSLELTFHKAFDEVQDWKQSMQCLIDLGFRRILTAGQASNVWNGRKVLKEIKMYAGDRIEIMAGGGVNAENIKELSQFATPDAIHFSGTKLQKLDADSRYSTDALIPDEELIRTILSEIKK